MNDLSKTGHIAPVVDSRCLTRRLALAPVSELPAAISMARAALTGADPEWIAGRAAALLSHYWRPDDPAHLAEAVIVDWIEALAIYPQWAIGAAVVAWNRTSDGRRPTPAHIARLCQAEVQPLREELARARSVLARVEAEAAVPVRSAEQKARVDALVRRITGRAEG